MKKIISNILYILALLILIFYFILEFTPNFDMSEFGRVFILCGSVISLYFGGLLRSTKDNNKPMRRNLWIFFFLYLLLLITLTLFDNLWGRNGFNIVKWNKEIFDNYINNNFNIIPFKTIMAYIRSFDSLYSTSTVMFNLLGNVVCLMPLGLFLPLLFKKQNKWYIFLLTCILFTLSIELLQFITISGSCDIDDVILNVMGAMIIYFITRIKTVSNIIHNIFLLEHHKISIKELIIVIIITSMIIGSIITLIHYRERIFNRNLNKHLSKYNYSLEIIDDDQDCEETLELFYQDKLYNYYFNCPKSDKVYALINGEKYLVKDLLNNNKTDYIVSIEKFKEYGLTYTREPKYPYITFKVEIPEGFQSLNVVATSNDEEIVEIANGEEEIKGSDFIFTIFFIPKEIGETKVNIKALGNDKTIKEFNYQMKVGHNLYLDYEEIL